jgi:hypothetical protein
VYRASLLLISLALSLGVGVYGAEKKEDLPQKGQRFYTQFSLYYEKDRHITTNYRRGIFVPINTEVTFVKSSHQQITVKIPSYGVTLHIQNEQKYSGEKIAGIFNRTFGPQTVDLSKFTELEQSSIKKGTAAVGMGKEAVIKAMGYPPRHKTPSLNMDQWRYWQSRFNTLLVIFEDGRVASIRD